MPTTGIPEEPELLAASASRNSRFDWPKRIHSKRMSQKAINQKIPQDVGKIPQDVGKFLIFYLTFFDGAFFDGDGSGNQGGEGGKDSKR